MFELENQKSWMSELDHKSIFPMFELDHQNFLMLELHHHYTKDHIHKYTALLNVAKTINILLLSWPNPT